jgi:Tol biopolymer transport system component
MRKFGPVTDGSRVYFTESESLNSYALAQVASAGGEVATLPIPIQAQRVADVSRDGSQLLVLGQRESGGTGPMSSELWTVPVVGGTPRRIGDLLGTGAAWSPDGGKVAYTVQREVRVASADGSRASTIWTAEGSVFGPVWAPDGRRLRVTVANERGYGATLWDVGADGAGPRPLLPGFEHPACCGRFTADGRYFVFQAEGDTTMDLWAVLEPSRWLPWLEREPVRLTRGPLHFSDPAPDRDGRRLFAVGLRRNGELVRHDVRSGQFLPYMSGPSIIGLDFSADGRWLTYVNYPDGTLWRSRADGSDRSQLTFAPRFVALPRFSPDGSRIAFAGVSPGEIWRIHSMPAEGGTPQPIAPDDDRDQADLSWAPDGSTLAFGYVLAAHRQDRPIVIRLLDVKTGGITSIRGSEGLFSPRWSPDGRRLAALSRDSLRLLLFDFGSGSWRELLSGRDLIAYPAWSRDGRHLFLNLGPRRVRLRVADGRQEVIASFEGLRQALGPFGEWIGQAPDESMLALRDTSIQEIFALEWERPL